jgi:hypothetical protein
MWIKDNPLKHNSFHDIYSLFIWLFYNDLSTTEVVQYFICCGRMTVNDEEERCGKKQLWPI